MTPFNQILNYSFELTQSSNFISKHVLSRVVSAFAIPFECMAVLENAIKLPFQTAIGSLSISAKVLNVFANSESLSELEEFLSKNHDVFKTAFKTVGYVIGTFFTALGTIFSPATNFQLHYSFDLAANKEIEKNKVFESENLQKISIIEDLADDEIKNPTTKPTEFNYLTDDQRLEIEEITKVPCPPIQEIVAESEHLIKHQITEEKLLDDENLKIDEHQKIKTIEELNQTQTAEHRIITPEISIDLVTATAVN